MKPIYVNLVASDAKVQAAALLQKIRQGKNVEVGNWEVLAWLNEMLLWVCNADLENKVQYVRQTVPGEVAIYTPNDIDKAIKTDDEIRPPCLEPAE